MLISLKIENFRSFRDPVILRMDATTVKELQEVVRTGLPGVPEKFHGMLTVASIHGANASGKSNLIKAAKLLDSLVEMAIRFPDGRVPDEYPFQAAINTVDPFRLDENSSGSPTVLEITFLLNEIRWAYSLTFDSTRIYSESLIYWPRGRPVMLFTRGKAVAQGGKAWLMERDETTEIKSPIRRPGKSPTPKAEPQRWKFDLVSSATPQQECWSWGEEFELGESEGQALAGRTRNDVAFLSVAASWNHPQSAQVIKWFSRFIVQDATQPNRLISIEGVTRACNSDDAVRMWVERWMRAADLGISAIEIEKTEERVESAAGTGFASRQRFQTKAVHQTIQGGKISFDMHNESHGTYRLFSLALTLYRVLTSGGVLLVDELHTALHPLLLRALIKIFQSPERNPLNAQLIFTTHDVSVLDNSLLRRDQIHIVEKSRDGISELYSVAESDYKPRKASPLIKYYLSGHLGGVPDLDLDVAFPMPNATNDSGEQ
jgi:AAA15 family ATPase/GTPase